MAVSFRFDRRILTGAALVLPVFALVLLIPNAIGARLDELGPSLGNARPFWLWIAGGSFLGTLVFSANAWRCAFRECGAEIDRTQALARFGIGSLVNSVSPARLGDATRVALFSRSLEGPDRLWTSSGVFAAIGAVKAAMLIAIVAVASASQTIPIWPIAALVGGIALATGLALATRRFPFARHALHMLDAFRALARSPRGSALLIGWVLAATLARLAAVAAIAAAFGVSSPLGAALVVVPALDLTGAVPLTPGNIGVTSAAVAAALQSRGVDFITALSAGLAFHAVEALVSLGFGLAGALTLARFRSPRLRRLTLAFAGTAAVLVFAAFLGVTVFRGLA
jgi:uncharacterized membrane protein YbhN (UPF0104 family)